MRPALSILACLGLIGTPVAGEARQMALASEIVAAVEQGDPDLFRETVAERATLTEGYDLGAAIAPEQVFDELTGCRVRQITEADHSPNVVVGGEPRVWWICPDRKPTGCFDVGYFGTFWRDGDDLVFRLQKEAPRNLERCPFNNRGPVIGSIPNG